MSVVCLDFETYYTSDYSLKKLPIEEYVRDPRFETIGVGISVGGGAPVWHPATRVVEALSQIDWTQTSLLAYHTMFDGAVLGWQYGIYPRLYLDAYGLARATGKTYKGGSIAMVAQMLGVGKKGTEVNEARGLRFADFTPETLARYGEYCVNDVNLCCGIYRKLAPGFPHTEYLIQDAVLRMFLEPTLSFDRKVLEEYYEEVITKKNNSMRTTADALKLEWNGDETIAQVKKVLGSAEKLAELLRGSGVEPPKKISKTTGKETYAFAKTDEEFIELEEHEDPVVQAIVSARLGIKSTIEETRAERLLGVQSRGLWPVPYLYYGAHTGRLSGTDKVNPQNFKRKGTLRKSIRPPAGHVLVAGDLSQIECRILNYWAGQTDIVEAFRQYDIGVGEDIYCILASKVYGKVITPADEQERTVGKVGELSLGFGGSVGAYQRALFAQAGRRATDSEAWRVVDTYRGSHGKVRSLWYEGDSAVSALLQGHRFSLGCFNIIDGSDPEQGIKLPNGMYVRYPLLNKAMHANGDTEFQYMNKRKFVRVYGAKVVENVVQALARIVMTDAWLRINRRYRVVLSTHDELVSVAPIAEAEECAAFMRHEMTQPVAWAPGLPIACKVGWGYNYAECK